MMFLTRIFGHLMSLLDGDSRERQETRERWITGNHMQQSFPARCKPGTLCFIVCAVTHRPPGHPSSVFSCVFFGRLSLFLFPSAATRRSRRRLMSLFSFNDCGDTRGDFISALKKTEKVLLSLPRSHRGLSERDTTPLYDSATADLVYISATAAGHIQT